MNREELGGGENNRFSQPSQELVDYASEHNIQLNLWSKTVQKVMQLRMRGQTVPQVKPPDDWRPWDI